MNRVTFLVLRRNEPDMERPFRVRYPRLVGWGAILLCLAMLATFFPPSDSALAWPEEWTLLGSWFAIGGGLLLAYRNPGATGRN